MSTNLKQKRSAQKYSKRLDKGFALYVINRVLFALVTIWAVVTITFIMSKLAPGNPFAGDGKISETAIKHLEEYYGLDKPIFIQYLNYLKSVLTFDFGPSLISDTLSPAFYIENGLPISMHLGFMSLVVAIIGGLFLGILAGLNHNKFPDYIAIVIAIVGISVPSFILARLLIAFFALELKWVPVSGWDSSVNYILPVITLAVGPMAQITRIMRANIIEVMNTDYIKTAKAKGLTKNKIIIRHAIKNAMLPVVSILGLIITGLLTGSFIVEKIYGIPGMGDALVNSVQNRDYPVIMATTVVYCVILIVMTLIIDLIYPLVDPRIKLNGGK